MWSKNPFHLTQVKCSRYVKYIIIAISVWFYGYSNCSKINVYIKEKMAEWSAVSRGSIKKFLVVTVAYVFTDIPLVFGQLQPLLF